MTFVHVIILSIIEGITEFLPVSSTGHLILVSHLLGITPTAFTKSFELFIQFGATAAVVFLYARRLLTDRKLWPKLVAAFIPTALVGVIFYPFIKETLLTSSTVTVWSLAIGGIFLIGFERFWKNKKGNTSLQNLSPTKSVLIGVAQSVSVIPGVSRAAASIIGGNLVGLTRMEAVEFSFLLALPTVAAATGYDLVKSSWQFNSAEFMLLGIGCIGAFVSALFAVRFFIRYVAHHSLTIFGVYRIFIALLFLIILR